jgi:hypothetical protein
MFVSNRFFLFDALFLLDALFLFGALFEAVMISSVIRSFLFIKLLSELHLLINVLAKNDFAELFVLFLCFSELIVSLSNVKIIRYVFLKLSFSL